jgi:GIY-YIG catalytic domain
MPWSGQNLPFTSAAISNSAPASSGVYAIWNKSGWIYFGESNDIQRRLLEHLNETGTCIKNHAPTSCGYEMWPANQRVARQNQLILELGSACNQKIG